MIPSIVDGVKDSSAGFEGTFIHGKSKLVGALDVRHGGLHSVSKNLGKYLEESF